MKCDEALPLINAWVDREIEDGVRVALEAHIATCPECQATADALRLADAELMKAFRADRDVARQVAERVTRSLKSDPITKPRSVPELRPVDWRSLALALVAGFLLALVIFPPHSPEPNSGYTKPIAQPESPRPNQHVSDTHPKGFARIATLVAATGDVQFDSGNGDWRVAPMTTLHCPSDSSFRTSKGALCELVTSDGAIIQMNSETEVKLRSPREVELQKGQVFCRAPEEGSIEVFSCEAPTSLTASENDAWSAAGSGNGFLTALSPDGEAQVISSQRCSVAVTTKAGRHQLRPGESASIVNGKVNPTGRTHDSLLSASWIHPLLIRKGHDNPDLNRRVDELFARIGREKMSMLYEREIRSLGEYCVVPLIRYVQSPISQKEPGRRASAMRIVADLAPSILIGELLPLLRDDSSEVRFQAARSLLRLTGESQGRSPAAWREPVTDSEETIASWTEWWQQNRGRYPTFKSPTKASPSEN
jgi:ferric-dicitrate binding protein FerR (iron transport regulator)